MPGLFASLLLVSLTGRGFAATNALGLTETLVFRAWGTEAGLPQNTINTVVQTRDGYLWVGTRDGLARFDGVRFTVFGLREGLPSVEVQVLFEDRAGTLWIGTSGGGLARLVNGRIETQGLPKSPDIGDNITALAQDDQGRVWIGSTAGLVLWKDDRLIKLPVLDTIARENIRTLFRDRHGALWISTTDGLFEFKEDQLSARPGPPGDEKIVAYCLLEDRRGGLWASVGNGKLLCRLDGEWRVYTEAEGVPFAFVTCMAEDGAGGLWSGSLDQGLYFFTGERFLPIRIADGLSADDIRSLCKDREGNLWIGTRTGGLNRLSRGKLLHYGAAEGLTNEFTRGVSQSADGTIWVGTTGGGLYHGDLEGFAPFRPLPVTAYYAHVDPVLATSDGSLWWGGARMLMRWHEGELAGCYTNEPWVRLAAITALCEGSPGELWVGSSLGRLAHFQNGRFTELPQRVARGSISALARQTNGVLWVGSLAGGLFRLGPGRDALLAITNSLTSSAIRTLHLDLDDTLWIGTAGGGLSRWKDGTVFNYTAQHGLTANSISQIVEDDEGHLWLGTSRGIVRVLKSELTALADGSLRFVHPRAYGVNDGMPSEECSSGFSPAGLRTRTGLICFSTVKGLVFVDPRGHETEAPPPAVVLEDVVVNGQVRVPETLPRDSTAMGSDGRSAANQPALRVVIPPGDRAAEFHYTGLSFGSPEKVSFRYRLEGLDRDWTEAGTRRTAYYPLVPPGEYVFRVIACNADGVWSAESTALAIRFLPFFWETAWFAIGSTFTVLVLAAVGLRFVERRKFKRKLEVLQTRHAIERERLRISQDMHDNVGAMLTQVSQHSDIGETEAGENQKARMRFGRVGSQARAAVQALDEIVWATNPKNDNLPNFADYLSGFADEYFETTAVRCWQEVPTDLPDRPLTANVRYNVFLAAKEAFNNALKHSKSTDLWLRLVLQDSEVRLEVEDNGCGFVTGRNGVGGNGLGNMKSRLAQCGGKAEISSTPDRGTKIRFTFPLRPPE